MFTAAWWDQCFHTPFNWRIFCSCCPQYHRVKRRRGGGGRRRWSMLVGLGKLGLFSCGMTDYAECSCRVWCGSIHHSGNDSICVEIWDVLKLRQPRTTSSNRNCWLQPATLYPLVSSSLWKLSHHVMSHKRLDPAIYRSHSTHWAWTGPRLYSITKLMPLLSSEFSQKQSKLLIVQIIQFEEVLYAAELTSFAGNWKDRQLINRFYN